MTSDLSISQLLDELVSGQSGGEYLHENLDLILSWLANPDSESVSRFRDEYAKRNISADILRGYVFFILKQKLFSNNKLQSSEILGLSKNATKDQVKARYRKLMRVFHPDKAVGNKEDFNEIAEKINRAYRQIRRQSDAPVHLKIDSGTVPGTVFSESEIGRDKIENQTLTKIRYKFGGARQFQLLFFGGLVSICLFVVVLLYLQSGDSLVSHSYSSRANTQEIDDHSKANQLIKTDAITPLLVENNAVIESTNADAAADSKNKDETSILKNIDSLAVNTKAKLNHPQQSVMQESKSQEKRISDSSVTVVESSFYDKEKSYQTNVAAQIGNYEQLTQSASAKAAEDSLDPSLEDLLSDGLTTDQSHTGFVHSQTRGELSRHSITNRTESAQQPVLQATQINSHKQEQLTSNSNEVKNSPVRSETKIQDNEFSNSIAENKSKHLKVEEQVSDFLDSSVSQVQVNQVSDRNIIAPVKEVEVATINSSSDRGFAVANIFEKRFARKFLIKYLESIEKGNLTQIKNYLSSTLIIDGVTNNKRHYLKNTYNLIGQTLKRSYHVKFVGDVLRLDPGVFRVTVILDHTYIFKNNIVAKDSAQKMFDIKRYSNGTEIINISSV